MFSIKKIQELQLPTLSEIAAQTFDESYSWGNPRKEMDDYIETHFSLERLQEEWRNEDSEFYFILNGHEVLGYLKINEGKAQTDDIFDNALEIERIYILKSHQGLSLGKKLMNHALRRAVQKKKTKIWLGVWELNPKAIAFYEKRGFEIHGTHDFIFGGKGQTDYVMKKDISVQDKSFF